MSATTITDGVEGLDDDDEFGNPPGYTDWYNTQFFGQPVDTKRDHACEAAWRAAMTFARRLRPQLPPAYIVDTETGSVRLQVDEAMVERMARKVAETAGEDYDSIGELAQGILKDTQRAALNPESDRG